MKRTIVAAALAAVALGGSATPAQAVPGFHHPRWHHVVEDTHTPYGGWNESHQPAQRHHVLRPCRFEDSTNCFWDARERGNHVGRSFITNRKGHVHYITQERATALTASWYRSLEFGWGPWGL